MTKRLMIGIFALAVSLIGCTRDEGPDPRTLIDDDGTSANWSLSLTSEDNMIAYNDTTLTISSNDTQYAVTWMGTAPNGTATLNTNTWTVTITATHTAGEIDLIGTLQDNDFMNGSGTIETYNGLRIVSWSASRE
ncbi:MAG: hypothetical protein HY343_11660 [Lentisphaerae bacterium]|nr:hypothetical protein [Lentisphaerota bacterium]